MMTIMAESSGDILGVRATEKLTEADYKNVLLPGLDALRERLGKVRVLFYMDEAFRGWDMKAAWANTTLDFRYRKDLEKVAIVGAPKWEEWCVRGASLLFHGELRLFKSGQIEEAWSWLRT